MKIVSAILAVLILAPATYADKPDLEARVLAAKKEAEAPAGYSFHVIGKDGAFSVVHGDAAPDGAALTPDHIYRIASVTKTFTAATALRLVEEGKLSLDATIDTLIDPAFDSLLKEDGYDTSVITLRQLMSHTAGMYDHPESENFVNGILENPQKEWTMQGQIKAGVDWGDPVGAPGEKFSYSDTGYVLLGNIIERASGVSLPVAVRTLLQLDKIAPGAIVWERGDSAPVPEERRVHQYFQGMDIFDWSPTIDLYGGGGLLASPKGMAEFFTALFSGEVFTKPETLEVMLSKEGLPEGSPYRLGVFDHKYDELHVYEHGGFWGTNVMYHPKSGTVIAGAVLKQSDYRQMISIMTGYLRNLE